MRRASAALLAALVLVGVGCSSVPRSSRATVVGPAPTAPVADIAAEAEIRRAGPPRSPESTPVELVSGFLEAEQDTTKDGTTRSQDYLTTPDDWDATGETLVYTTKEVELGVSLDPAIIVVQVTYSTLGRIVTDLTGAGDYQPDVGRDVQTFDVRRSDAGGYRISRVPRGRRVNDGNLDQVFRRVVPYFCATRDCDMFVPAPIYVLKQSSTQVAAVLSRLLAGPTPVLEDFLPPSLFPARTSLLTATEPEDNLVEVTFSRELNDSRPFDRPKIVAQIVWTLTALDSRIAAVSIKVSDQPFKLPGDKPTEAQGQQQWRALDPDAAYAARTSYFNLDGTLGRYRPSSAVHAGRQLDPIGVPAVDAENESVAVTAQVRLLSELRVGPIATGPLVAALKAEHLTKPSWGTRRDGVWVVSQQGDGAPEVLSVPGDAKGNVHPKTPELSSRVYAFEVAPDGLRVAAIVDRGGQRSLEIGYVDRQPVTGAALRVGGFRPVVNGANVSALSVAWLDSGKLAFIGQRGEEDPEVFTVLIDGTDLRSLSGSRAVLQLNRPAPAIQPQLVPLGGGHDGTRRGDASTPDQVMLVIDGSSVYVRRRLEWAKVPARPRNQ